MPITKEVIVLYTDDGMGNSIGEIVGEVVRCKDCIYYHKGNWYDDDVCKVHSNNDRGYCAWGERK